jgi:hypothetical protein
MTGIWRAYYPEDGETADDARVIAPRWDWQKRFLDAEDAARRACEIDYDERDGWERSRDSDFPIVVIAPDGTETHWTGRHEPSVEHVVEEVEDE